MISCRNSQYIAFDLEGWHFATSLLVFCTKVDRSHQLGVGHFSAGHCGQGQRINQGSFPLSCVRRLEEATSHPFLISFRSLSYNFFNGLFHSCRSCPSPHIMDMCLLLTVCAFFAYRRTFAHSFQGSGSGFLTMSLQLIFNDTLAYASVLKCSESQRLHNETRYGHGGRGRSGAEHSICDLTSFPAKPCKP